MSNRINRHATFGTLRDEFSRLIQEIEVSDKLDFGDVDDRGQAQNHDQVKALDRQLNQVKRALKKREQASVDATYMRLVKQVKQAAGGDMSRVKEALTLATQQVQTTPDEPGQIPENSTRESPQTPF